MEKVESPVRLMEDLDEDGWGSKPGTIREGRRETRHKRVSTYIPEVDDGSLVSSPCHEAERAWSRIAASKMDDAGRYRP